MKNSLCFVLSGALILAAAAAEDEVRPQPYYGHIAQRLGAMLPRNHVLRSRWTTKSRSARGRTS